MESIIEAAMTMGEYDCDINKDKFHAKITWKCPVCERRNCKLVTGTGCVYAAMPIVVTCKQGHKTEVVPYRWSTEPHECSTHEFERKPAVV